MRLIDADALLKALVRKELFNDCARVVIAECMQEVRHAPTIEPEQQWIHCSEMLPENGKWCLFTDGINMSVERYKADAIDHFFPEGRWFGLDNAVAWMPLPEPYAERRTDETD